MNINHHIPSIESRRLSSWRRVAVWFGAIAVVIASAGVSWADESRIAADHFSYSSGFAKTTGDESATGFQGPWKLSEQDPAEVVANAQTPDAENPDLSVLIRGSGERNNPLRRQLKETFAGDELFVGFRFAYEPRKQPAKGVDPEFFVLWLDRTDGSDRAVHAAQVPNIGVHLTDRGPTSGKNVFMVRFGSKQTAWTRTELEPGKTYRLIARLSKQKPGPRNDFSQIQLWIDPIVEDENQPVISLEDQEGLHQIRWVGFATGLKTEREDRIHVDDLVLSKSWKDAFTFLHEDGSVNIGETVKRKPPYMVWKEPVDFAKDIYPILKTNCFECHAGEFPDSGFRLDVRNELLGYSTGEAFVEPGNSEHSRLIEVLTTKTDGKRMPPEGEPLSEVQVAKVRAWIDQGLKWDDELLPTPQVTSDHWAFAPVKRPSLPTPVTKPEQAIDTFIAAAHARQSLTASAEADRRILIRRLYLDLLGLPPTTAEIDSFLNDEKADAYERLVDQVLKSPHYGERMGRYWLDLARWGESQGYQHDIPRPFAWRYRDYVIEAFNKDKPYDQFLKEQFAGDELQPYSDESLIATGFLAAARISGNQMDKRLQRNDVMIDIVDNASSAVLGLTMECARCHNHKFEPLSQRDYYALAAFFTKGQMGNLALRESANIPADEIKQWFTKDSYQFYLREAKKLRIDPKDYPAHTWGYYSPATGDKDIERLKVVNRSPLPYSPEMLRKQETHILIRGDAHKPGLRVEPAWPAVLGETPSELSPTPRQAFADWLGDDGNPLVARVWVNRLWQTHFGRGIVRTESNFGVKGAQPSHPELLDWLAAEFMDSGYSTKHIHRLIVLSKTYRQSSLATAENIKYDPENVLLWRWPQRRLEAEAIRDSLLVATGELNRKTGGPSVAPALNEQELRRTIYLSQRRSQLPDVMTMFDAPDGIRSCSRREVSTVPLQPLYLLNSPFVVKRAESLAALVTKQAADDRAAQIKLIFQRTLGRDPTAAEIAFTAKAFPREANDEKPADDLNLIRLCQAMMNLNEFVYIP